MPEVESAKTKIEGTPDLSEAEGISIDRIKDQLQHGEIPKVLREELKIVDEHSPEGEKFQEILNKLVTRLYSEKKERSDITLNDSYDRELHELINNDFKTNPIRFFLSDDYSPNAGYIKYSKPPCIVLNRGLFIDKQGSQNDAIIQNISDLVLVVCHEITHYKLDIRQGYEHENSKLEETLAYTTPLLQLFMNGLDPSETIATFDRLNRAINSQDENILSYCFDVHPNEHAVKEICTSFVAKLEKTYGSLKTINSTIGNDTISDIFECVDVQHESALKEFFDKKKISENSSITEKINTLNEFLISLNDSELYPARIKSCIDYFRNLKIDKESKDIRKTVSKLADTILEKIQQYDLRELELFYKICCSTLSKSGSNYPIGRLKNLRQAYNDFINTAEDYGDELTSQDRRTKWNAIQEIKESAEILVEIYRDEEEFCQEHLSFLQTLKWGKNYESNQIKLKKFKQFLTDILNDTEVQGNPAIIEAAVLTGLHADPEVMGVLAKNQELFLKYYKQNFDTFIGIYPYENLSIEKSDIIDSIIKSKISEIFNESSDKPEEYKKLLEILDNESKRNFISKSLEFKNIELMKKNPKSYFELTAANYTTPKKIKELLSDIEKIKETDKESYLKILRILYDLDKNPDKAKPLNILGGYRWRFEEGTLFFDFFNKIKDKEIISERDKKTILVKILVDDSPIHPYTTDKIEVKYFFKIASILLEKKITEFEKYSYSEINTLINNISSSNFRESEKVFLYKFAHLLFFQRYKQDEDVPYDVLTNFSKKIFINIYNPEYENIVNRFILNSREFLDKELLIKSKNLQLDDFCSDYVSLKQVRLISDELKVKVGDYIISALESISLNQEYDIAMQICKYLLINKAFDLIRIKNKIIDKFVENFRSKYGVDDGSKDYSKKIKEYINNEFQNDQITNRDRYQLYDKLASKIEAQKDLSFFFEEQLQILTEENLQDSNYYGRFCDYIYAVLKKDVHADKRIATVNFLLSKGEQSDALEYLNNFQDYFRDTHIYFDYQTEPLSEDERFLLQKSIHEVTLFYENFQDYSLPEKAIFIKTLLADKNGNISNDIYDSMLDKIFSSDIPYGQVCKDLLKTHISYYGKYYRDLLFSALLTANDSKDNGVHSAGELFVLFAENMGPAYIKVMQGVEGNSAIPLDLRNDISKHARRLKFDGARPTRWELWHCLEAIDPNALDKFSHIGDIIGNASMNIAVDVMLQNGEHRILSLLRPNAERKAKYGFEKMILTAQDNKYQGNEYSTIITDLVSSAQDRIGLEANCLIAPEQYDKAGEMYNKKCISINGKRFISSAAEVQEAGSNYYIMNKIAGQHFSELPEDTDEQIQFKKDCAKAILTLELSHILNGQFDADRHGGQMKIVQNGSNVSIGHFDFKGMRLDKWQDKDYQQLAEILYTTALQNLSSRSNGNTTSISQTFSTQSFIEAENEIIKRGEQISPLISEVRKALLSLNEYFNLLDDKEIAEVAFSALLSGRLSPTLVNSIADNVVNAIYSSSLPNEYSILKITPKGIIKTLVKKSLQKRDIPDQLKGMLNLPDDFKLLKISF